MTSANKRFCAEYVFKRMHICTHLLLRRINVPFMRLWDIVCIIVLFAQKAALLCAISWLQALKVVKMNI